ncbi:hypothetical protein BX616_009183 [Lobosporangium transversale]|uniref:Uncharacterized protein n=1 Tax=Lobosporangium transversale TaxID=64571 RepID=A0A1Y2GZM9_9FUNG|nr:hypothetical protein BCR41DRAFT_367341 [Lobosporangium transversale]KAF9913992.1 hypothetical protein BX616_009183 [Lobosporangium transversale]ORZ27759.1 hypothetical protein BCR41DRAFT_367341 [Lobosporangium transversale]|eukprot:XP_021885462.1 hypothetical protein BCR41DRAFT_367341 [Lobosporangium transversale]
MSSASSLPSNPPTSPLEPTPTTPIASSTTSPSQPSNPTPPNPDPSSDPTSPPDPSQTSRAPKPPSTKTRSGGNGGSGGNPPPGATQTSDPDDNGHDPNKKDGGESGSKNVLAPVIGGIAAVLVLAFLVAVFVMRQKKKNRARKRRLEFLDHSGAAAPGAGATARPTSVQNSNARPSTPAGGHPLEMAAIGGAAVGAGAGAASQLPNSHNNDGFDYQQGYQQVPYGAGYQEQYDQYDPYYAQRQQQQQGQAYYADQQQGYYPPEDYQQQQQYQNQFVPPAPIGYANNSNNYSQGTGSPSMTHATASPKSYPQPPPSTTGGHSSPRTPFQNASGTLPVPSAEQTSYDKNAKIESGYIGTQSTARNPQLVPENEERIKVPL